MGLAEHGVGLEVGDLEGAGRSGDAHAGLDAGHAEHPGRLPVAVEAHEVPAAVAGGDAPRFDVPDEHGPVVGGAVAERDDAAGLDGFHEGPVGVTDGTHGRREPGQRVGRRVARTRGPQLDHGARDVGLQRLVLPELGGQGQHAELGGREVDRRQRVGVLVDAVAELVGVPAGADGHHGDAEGAQHVLVPLEHPLERLVAGRVGVAGHGGAHLLLGHGGVRVHERDDEVQEALGGVESRGRGGGRGGGRVAGHQDNGIGR